MIVFASLSTYNDLTDAMLAFNMVSDRYRVSLEYFETVSREWNCCDRSVEMDLEKYNLIV